jgi:hypothetical protein
VSEAALTDVRLPSFDLDEYRKLLTGLLDRGYVARAVEEMVEPHDGLDLYLRHDIDIHIQGIERMAAVESQLGAVATYYVPLTLSFNPFYPQNRRILRELMNAGHRIGLHYDLIDYPRDDDAARARLDQEADMLAQIIGEPPRTICMHAPSIRGEDRFYGIEGYVHPHDPRYGQDLTYVSDSCRAWRDETLLRCFGDDQPRRLLLLTHPELWLGRAEESRDEFLHGALLEQAVEQPRAALIDELGGAWRTHPGPAAEDARLRSEER